MVRPILEYGSSVWDPHPDKLQKELEKVQNRAARFVTRNYVYETGSMTGIRNVNNVEHMEIVNTSAEGASLPLSHCTPLRIVFRAELFLGHRNI